MAHENDNRLFKGDDLTQPFGRWWGELNLALSRDLRPEATSPHLGGKVASLAEAAPLYLADISPGSAAEAIIASRIKTAPLRPPARELANAAAAAETDQTPESVGRLRVAMRVMAGVLDCIA